MSLLQDGWSLGYILLNVYFLPLPADNYKEIITFNANRHKDTLVA